jgi:hypothetical protein
MSQRTAKSGRENQPSSASKNASQPTIRTPDVKAATQQARRPPGNSSLSGKKHLTKNQPGKKQPIMMITNASHSTTSSLKFAVQPGQNLPGKRYILAGNPGRVMVLFDVDSGRFSQSVSQIRPLGQLPHGA